MEDNHQMKLVLVSKYPSCTLYIDDQLVEHLSSANLVPNIIDEWIDGDWTFDSHRLAGGGIKFEVVEC